MGCFCEGELNCPNICPPLLRLSLLQPSTMASTLSMSGPITKVVKNDAYTAPPRPPVPVAPTRPTSHMAASRAPPAALQPVSRTLQQNTAETSTTAATPPQVRHPPQICSRVRVVFLSFVVRQFYFFLHYKKCHAVYYRYSKMTFLALNELI